MGPDYELGIKRLRAALLQQSPEGLEEFEMLKARLRRNMNEARRYGDDPTNRVEWNKIIDGFIQLTNERLSISFNDLCRPEWEMMPSEEPSEDLTALPMLRVVPNHAMINFLHWTRRHHPEIRNLRHLPENELFRLFNEFTGGRFTWNEWYAVMLEGNDERASADLSQYKGTQNRWAVLVGVDTYKDRSYSRLHVCTHDLNAITQQLSTSGFTSAHMHILVDGTPKLPTRENILTTLKMVAQATKTEDLLLFYYTGHGDVDANESYLVAKDGRLANLEDTAVAVTQIKKIMLQAAARAKVLILDACHGGAAIGTKGSRRMSPDFIRRVFEQAQGIAILSSCMQNQVSYEWQRQSRSVFTYYLLEALQGLADNDDKGFVTVADIHRHVTDGVTQWALDNKKPQTPTFQAEMTGEIIICYYK
jgi:hypothetical protein